MSDDPQIATRRDVIQKLGAGTTATLLVGTASAQVRAQAGGEQEEIVIARGGLDDEPRSTERVPATWKRHEDALDQLQNVLGPRFVEKQDFVNGLRITRSNDSIDEYNLSKLEFQVSPSASERQVSSLPRSLPTAKTKVNLDLPSMVENNVQVQEISVKRDAERVGSTIVQDQGIFANRDTIECGKLTDEWFCGGWLLNTPKSFATAGYRVRDTNKNKDMMMTANHILTTDCEVKDNVKVHDHNGNHVGTSTSQGHKGVDWTLLESSDNFNWSNQIDRGYPDGLDSIDGWVTKEGAQSINSRGDDVHRFGVGSGHSQGPIKGLGESNYESCQNFYLNAVTTGASVANHDSGGPHWFENSDGTFIFGQQSLGTGDGPQVQTCSSSGEDAFATSWFYPFFRIKQDNPHLRIAGLEYNG
ncbi:hypothetical protein [Halomicrobium salinisoli]|uniref:hypothetical protein n=1 Tax=Halomicrobium salinisoli TaxID=2878391 RepID=UPI001CEFB4F1|nr:hypothetical protein [Halomicrobium salinisoli]